MKKAVEFELPDIDEVVATALIEMKKPIVIKAVDDEERGTFYYLRLDASEVVNFDMTDTETLEELTDSQRTALTNMFDADSRSIKQWDGLLSYDGSWNVTRLSWNFEEARERLKNYIACQKKLFPKLMIVNGGIY